MSTMPQASFTKDFVRLNRLDEIGFGRWVFLPGMEFETRDKCWADTGSRPIPHEGLDICCFEDKEGQVVYLGENSLVPILYDGRIVKIFTDFLDESIMVVPVFQKRGRSLYSIYAHTVPDKSMRAGCRVKAGQPICAICPSKNRSMKSHLHLTVLWAPEEKIANLDW